MADPPVRLYCSHGRLYYHPSDPPDKPPQLFRPRRVGPGYIRVQAVSNNALEPPRCKVVPHNSKRRRWIVVKLATSRENAKRFLRSVIAQPSATRRNNSSTGTEETVDPLAKKKSNRRSWSPIKRSESGGGAAVQPPETGIEEPGTMRGGIRSSIGGPVSGMVSRPRLNSDVRNSPRPTANGNGTIGGSNTVANGVVPALDLDSEKPLASGNGVSMGIQLAEPVLFLQGFEQADSHTSSTAMLRGSLHLRVQKSAKIKAVTLKFKGKSITKWPEGVPPKKTEFDEQDTIMSHTWPFFNAQFESAEKGTNADHVKLFGGPENASAGAARLDPLGRSSPANSNLNLNSKEAKKLSLAVNQSRSFGKGDSAGPSVASKGYRTFLPGDYVYNFELPLDSRLPETIDVELGSVKYELEAIVERSGAFRANLAGSKEVTLIRSPSEGSLEQVEPIAISRNWEDQLHYDIVISGKSFPLGSQVPIAFKLTPLAKVQCHRIKVLVTENIEYFCSNKRVHRMEPTRKVLLFEKRADGPPTSTFPGSTMRVITGGGVPYEARARAARGEDVPTNDTTNLLGNLEGDTNVGPTEMEFSVQLPSCHTMKDRDRTQKLHFDTTYQNIQVHHWIKIVMRLSKPDATDPAKRRHFEISIDSPFHILSCRATQANTSLPAYSSPENGNHPHGSHLYECGCPGAQRRTSPTNGFVPTLNSLNTQQPPPHSQQAANGAPLDLESPGLARPQAAHLNGPPGTRAPRPPTQPSAAPPPPLPPSNHPAHPSSRPIHMLRAPSFNPPAFEEEAPPPALITPPPQYDSIASPTSGLADYFARLSDAYEDDEEEESDGEGRGRVNVPLTPGGRVNRSMDVRRTWRANGM